MIDALPVRTLRAALEERFGAVNQLDLLRGKACAFLDFANVESAREAIRVSRPVRFGGEGGFAVPGTDFIVHVTVRVRRLSAWTRLTTCQRTKAEVLAFQEQSKASKGAKESSARGGRGGAARGRGRGS